ncbi:hypothetical protein HRbin02_01208 [Candidatus Calditenuaceae archaeon HR02]|nr:hypothetical protein HRbin02_01208 [Candidatus Calditenuaceae archaeon HR02]
MLTPLEKALLEGELGGQARWRVEYLFVEDSGEDGSIILTLSEGVGEGCERLHMVSCYLGRLPLRAGSVGGAVVRQHSGSDTLSLILFEVNRALVDGGALVLSAKVDDPSRLLVKHGFALVSEHRPGGGEGFSVTLSRKAWRKYLGDACPRCGSTHILPLIPPDANVRKVWTLYCSSCSYNWSVEEPITEWI